MHAKFAFAVTPNFHSLARCCRRLADIRGASACTTLHYTHLALTQGVVLCRALCRALCLEYAQGDGSAPEPGTT